MSTVQTYSFTFPMPSQSLAVNLPVAATFGITLTAAEGDTAVFSLAPGQTSFMQSSIDGKDVGIDVGSATETVDNGTEVFSFPSSSTDITLTSTGTSMSVTTTFDLSPGDSASFSGSFVIQGPCLSRPAWRSASSPSVPVRCLSPALAGRGPEFRISGRRTGKSPSLQEKGPSLTDGLVRP